MQHAKAANVQVTLDEVAGQTRFDHGASMQVRLYPGARQRSATAVRSRQAAHCSWSVRSSRVALTRSGPNAPAGCLPQERRIYPRLTV